MIDKFKNVLNNNVDHHIKTQAEINTLKEMTEENLWAHIYHDSIRGNKAIENLALNIGRWAGNYSFFYVLNRILKDFNPKRILELGLGESSKFISTYINDYESKHIIIEHDEKWISFFKNSFDLSPKSEIRTCKLENKNINNHTITSYKDFRSKTDEIFDFIVVDGPFGSDHLSRYDIIEYIVANNFKNDFVILFDDTHRNGEKETFAEMIKQFKAKNIDIYVAHYAGNKTCSIISNLQFLTSL